MGIDGVSFRIKQALGLALLVAVMVAFVAMPELYAQFDRRPDVGTSLTRPPTGNLVITNSASPKPSCEDGYELVLRTANGIIGYPMCAKDLKSPK
jgi:hypothetical protein